MPINFPPISNPLKTQQINYFIELVNNTYKKETHPLEIKLSALEIKPCALEIKRCALETINIKKWLRVFTDISYTCNQRNTGSDVSCKLLYFKYPWINIDLPLVGKSKQ